MHVIFKMSPLTSFRLRESLVIVIADARPRDNAVTTFLDSDSRKDMHG